MAPEPKRFVVLDAWRGLSALFVALFHLPVSWHFVGSMLVQHAWMWVDFFFVLSGFVIAHAYAHRLDSGREVAAFMVRRIGRLWPLHAAILGTFILLVLAKSLIETIGGVDLGHDPNNSVPAAITNLFLVQSLGLHEDLTWNRPSWSVSAELWTNVLFGICCWLFVRYRSAVFALLAVIGLLGVLVLAHGNMATAVDYGLLRSMYGFFLGNLVFKIYASGKRLSRRGTASLAETLAVIAMVALVVFATADGTAILSPIVFAIAIWLFAQERGIVSDILGGRAFVVLGTLSYSIYMVHYLIVVLLGNAFALLGKAFNTTFFVPESGTIAFGNVWLMDLLTFLYLGTVVGFAWLTWSFIEVPWRRRFNRAADALAPRPPHEPDSDTPASPARREQ